MSKTAIIAKGFHGDKLYQRRARQILPILVRQAEAGAPLCYEALADEVEMPNPRNLNYPLGCIGDAINHIAAPFNHDIPHIQAIVVNQGTKQPGLGFDEFFKQHGYSWSTKAGRRAIVEEYWVKIFTAN